jgi:2-dehydropantoate 2-reductase
MESHRSKKLARAAQDEAIQIGRARGYKLEEIDHLPPERIARAGEGDLAALKTYDERRLPRVGRGSPDQRPSMGQDMAKGRRTEIEFLNGFVVREGEQVGIQARASERLVDIVKKVERGKLKQDPRHITELRLN